MCESDTEDDRRDEAVDGPIRLCVQLGMTCKENGTNVDIASRNTARNIAECKKYLFGLDWLRNCNVRCKPV